MIHGDCWHSKPFKFKNIEHEPEIRHKNAITLCDSSFFNTVLFACAIIFPETGRLFSSLEVWPLASSRDQEAANVPSAWGVKAAFFPRGVSG